MSQGTSGTYYYSPDIKVFINTVRNGVIDISDDIMSFDVNRQVNAVSSANFIIANKGFKYTPGRKDNNFNKLPVINTLDRIIVYLKRQTYLQVFSGYITYAPVVTLTPSPIELRADCTLKKLQDNYWDPSAVQIGMKGLVPGLLQNKQVKDYALAADDGGVGQGIINVLTKVANWPASNIHISRLPSAWITNALAMATSIQAQLDQATDATSLLQLLDGNGVIAGSNILNQNGTNTGYKGAKPGTYIPNGAFTNAVLFKHRDDLKNSAGNKGYTAVLETIDEVLKKYPEPNNVVKTELIKNPPQAQDKDWWCVVSWPYANITGPPAPTVSGMFTAAETAINPNVHVTAQDEAKAFLSRDNTGQNGNTNNKSGRKILLTNVDTGTQIVVRATFTNTSKTDKNIYLGRVAWEALAGRPMTYELRNGTRGDFYGGINIPVTAAFVDPGTTGTGVHPSTDLKQKLNALGYDTSRSLVQIPPAELREEAVSQSGGAGGTQTNGSDIPPRAIEEVKKYKGIKYVFGAGHGNKIQTIEELKKTGIDCSGLVYYVYRGAKATDFVRRSASEYFWKCLPKNSTGYKIDPHGVAKFAEARKVDVANSKVARIKYKETLNQCLPGDLLFWVNFADDNTSTAEGSTDNFFVYDSNDHNPTDVLKRVAAGNNIDHVSIFSRKDGDDYYHWQAAGDMVNEYKIGIPVAPWDSKEYKTFNLETWGKQGVLVGMTRYYGNWSEQPTGSQPGSTDATGTQVGRPTIANGTDNGWNFPYQEPSFDNTAQLLFGSPRAFVTDEPVLNSISQLATTGLRCFQSAPNGDFVAWFPDYFGTYGTAPVMNIHDIEIIDFKLTHDDAPLTTHVGIAADSVNLGQGVDYLDWVSTNGIVSIQLDAVVKMLFGITPGGSAPFNATAFLQRYGMRPYKEELPQVRSHVLEFMYAWQTFTRKWAQQYNSQLSLTFMPELYPGMRIRLADHDLELYVENVSHQGSREGGFSTEAVVTSPITRTSTGKVKIIHYGFPV